jgi:hypothetical protein
MKPRNLSFGTIPKNLDFYVQSIFLQIYLFLLWNLVLKVAYLHYFMVLEHIVILLVDLGLGRVFTLLLLVGLEIIASSYAIFGAPAHLISALAWERFVALD